MTKKKKFKWLEEHPCKVCGRMIPKPMIYCSSKCKEIDEKRGSNKMKNDIPKLLEWDL